MLAALGLRLGSGGRSVPSGSNAHRPSVLAVDGGGDRGSDAQRPTSFEGLRPGSPHYRVRHPPAPFAWLRDHPVAASLWAAPACAVLAVVLNRRAAYDPPDGIGTRPIQTLHPGTIVWSAIWLWLLAILVVVTICSFLWRTTLSVEAWFGIVLVTIVPLAVIPVIGASVTSLRGCGSPYRELMEPLPVGVEVVSEDVGFLASSGAPRSRDLVLQKEGTSSEDLLGEVADALVATGWTLQERGADGVLGSSPPDPSPMPSTGAEWYVIAATADPQRGDEPHTVRLSLEHHPDAEACINE